MNDNAKKIHIKHENDLIYKSKFRFSSHYEVIFCESGNVVISTPEKTITAEKDICIFIPAFYSYKVNFDSFCGDIVTFKSSYIKASFSKYIANSLLLPLSKDIFAVKIDKGGITKNLESLPLGEKFAFLDLARLLIYFKDNAGLSNKYTIANKDFSDITRYINENLSTPLHISDIADSFSTSVVYINRIFKKEVALTPAAYISGTRFIQATKLLTESELSINEICTNCGYSSRTHFQNVFKKRTGMTPKLFREIYYNDCRSESPFKYFDSYLSD